MYSLVVKVSNFLVFWYPHLYVLRTLCVNVLVMVHVYHHAVKLLSITWILSIFSAYLYFSFHIIITSTNLFCIAFDDYRSLSLIEINMTGKWIISHCGWWQNHNSNNNRHKTYNILLEKSTTTIKQEET